MIILKVDKYIINTPDELFISDTLQSSYSTDFYLPDSDYNRKALDITGIAQYDGGGLWKGSVKECLMIGDMFTCNGTITVMDIDTEKGIHCFLTSVSVSRIKSTVSQLVSENYTVLQYNNVSDYRENLHIFPFIGRKFESGSWVNYDPTTVSFYDGARIPFNGTTQPAFITPLPAATMGELVNMLHILGYQIEMPTNIGYVWQNDRIKSHSLILQGNNKYRKIAVSTQTLNTHNYLMTQNPVYVEGARRYVIDGDYAGITDNNINVIGMVENTDPHYHTVVVEDNFTLSANCRVISVRMMPYILFNDTSYPVTCIATVSAKTSSGQTLWVNGSTSMANAYTNVTNTPNSSDLNWQFIIMSTSGDISANTTITVKYEFLYDCLPTYHQSGAYEWYDSPDFRCHLQYFFDDDYKGYKKVLNDEGDADGGTHFANSEDNRDYIFTKIQNGINSQALGILPTDYDLTNTYLYNEQTRVIDNVNPALQYFCPLLNIESNIEEVINGYVAYINGKQLHNYKVSINTDKKKITVADGYHFYKVLENRLFDCVEADKELFEYPYYSDGADGIHYFKVKPQKDVDEDKNEVLKIANTYMRQGTGILDIRTIDNNDWWGVSSPSYTLTTTNLWWSCSSDYIDISSYDAFAYSYSDNQHWGSEDRYNFFWSGMQWFYYQTGLVIPSLQKVVRQAIVFVGGGEGTGSGCSFYTPYSTGATSYYYGNSAYNIKVFMPSLRHQKMTFTMPDVLPSSLVTIKSNSYYIMSQEFTDGENKVEGVLIMP